MDIISCANADSSSASLKRSRSTSAINSDHEFEAAKIRAEWAEADARDAVDFAANAMRPEATAYDRAVWADNVAAGVQS